MVAVLIFLRDLQYFPTYLLSAVLSAPGLAALFAIYRDHPGLSSASARARRQAVDSMSKAANLFVAVPTKAVRTFDALREKQEKAA